jgi:hypothetical protein
MAMDCLSDGWTYTLALPGSWTRVRLSCSWPILLGIRTLQPFDQSTITSIQTGQSSSK